MNILLVNDDGYFAKGINLLYELLKNTHKVVIVAPKTTMSAKSVSIIIDRPVEVIKINDYTYSTNVQTIGFSIQVTADCSRRIDYFYAYSATDDEAAVKSALNNPIYKNTATPKQYDNGYFYDLDYDIDGEAQPGFYLLIASEAGTRNYIVYGYCEVK